MKDYNLRALIETIIEVGRFTPEQAVHKFSTSSERLLNIRTGNILPNTIERVSIKRAADEYLVTHRDAFELSYQSHLARIDPLGMMPSDSPTQTDDTEDTSTPDSKHLQFSLVRYDPNILIIHSAVGTLIFGTDATQNDAPARAMRFLPSEFDEVKTIWSANKRFRAKLIDEHALSLDHDGEWEEIDLTHPLSDSMAIFNERLPELLSVVLWNSGTRQFLVSILGEERMGLAGTALNPISENLNRFSGGGYELEMQSLGTSVRITLLRKNTKIAVRNIQWPHSGCSRAVLS